MRPGRARTALKWTLSAVTAVLVAAWGVSRWYVIGFNEGVKVSLPRPWLTREVTRQVAVVWGRVSVYSFGERPDPTGPRDIRFVHDPMNPPTWEWGFEFDSMPVSYGPWWQLWVPLWAPILVAGIPAALLWRSGRRRDPGAPVCPKCGYDRRGLAASVRCPECGAGAAAPAAR